MLLSTFHMGTNFKKKTMLSWWTTGYPEFLHGLPHSIIIQGPAVEYNMSQRNPNGHISITICPFTGFGSDLFWDIFCIPLLVPWHLIFCFVLGSTKHIHCLVHYTGLEWLVQQVWYACVVINKKYIICIFYIIKSQQRESPTFRRFFAVIS